MIREETYYKLANEFGTGIGVAESNQIIYNFGNNIRKIPDDVKVMILTEFVIKQKIYQPVIREVLRLEEKYKNKRINKSTIYEKAINNVVEQYQIDIE